MGRMTGTNPRWPPAIEDRNGIVSHPTEHPPEPCRKGSAPFVIGHHLLPRRNTQTRKRRCKCIRCRQRMPTRLAGQDGAGKILIQMGVKGTRYVPLQISMPTGFRILQIKPAIHDTDSGGLDQGVEIGYRNQGGVEHDGVRGAGCGVRGAGCGVRGAGKITTPYTPGQLSKRTALHLTTLSLRMHGVLVAMTVNYVRILIHAQLFHNYPLLCGLKTSCFHTNEVHPTSVTVCIPTNVVPSR